MLRFLLGLLSGAFLVDFLRSFFRRGPRPLTPVRLSIEKENGRWRVRASDQHEGPVEVRSGGEVTWTLHTEGPAFAVIQVDPRVFPNAGGANGAMVLVGGQNPTGRTLTARNGNRDKGYIGRFVDYEFSYTVLCFDGGEDPNLAGIQRALREGNPEELLRSAERALAEGHSPPRMIIRA